jgi:hypothetical protein
MNKLRLNVNFSHTHVFKNKTVFYATIIMSKKQQYLYVILNKLFHYQPCLLMTADRIVLSPSILSWVITNLFQTERVPRPCHMLEYWRMTCDAQSHKIIYFRLRYWLILRHEKEDRRKIPLQRWKNVSQFCSYHKYR